MPVSERIPETERQRFRDNVEVWDRRETTRNRHGHIACCVYPTYTDSWIGVNWSTSPFAVEVEHVRACDLSFLPLGRVLNPFETGTAEWNAEITLTNTPDGVDDAMRRMTEAFAYVADVSTAARTRFETTTGSLEVGTTNNENEGEEMPNATTEEEVDTIQVPHSRESLEELFNSHDLSTVLMSGLDQENWERHRQELQTAVQENVEWSVRRGSFAMDNYPTIMVGRNRVRIRTTPVSVAQEFLASASNSRLAFVPMEDYVGAYRLRPISSLEDAAWAIYGGHQLYIYADQSQPVATIDLRNLSSIMDEFTRFMRGSDHRRYLRQAIHNRMGVPNKPQSPEKNWDTKRVEGFQKFIQQLKGRLRPEENPFQKLPILPHKTLSSRTWGIEIEAVDIGGIKTPEYWDLKSDGSLRNLAVSSMPSRTWPAAPTVEEVGSTNPPTPPLEPNRDDHDDECESWNEDEDSGDNYPCDCGYTAEWEQYRIAYHAYVAQHGDPYGSTNTMRSNTGEWNSPVLRSYHSRGLKYLTDELEPRDTNDSAGVHVHVGAKDLSPEQAVQLSLIYTALEPLFESEYKRGATRSYCKSPDVAELINRFQAMRKAKEEGKAATEMRFSSRYWTVNLAALQSHKTVEFRAMGSVYNYDHLVRWAYFCRELVNIAKANVPQSEWARVHTIEDLVTLFSKYGKETPTPAWAATEIATDVLDGLGSENRRLPQAGWLDPASGRGPRLVNDDYTASQTYFLGERPATREDDREFDLTF